MISCIAGMHRSGTSLLAQMLHLSGVWLGPDELLMAATSENPDGYWEHLSFVGLNEEVLNELGGAWDRPPVAPDWETSALDDLRERARILVKEFESVHQWAWKDPRNSVTLPFWLDIVPEARIVACLRNPLDVALSLRQRGGFSYASSLELWFTYYQRLLETAPTDRLLLVHFENVLNHPGRELGRVLSFLGIDAEPSCLAAATAAVKPGYRHHHTPSSQLLFAGVAAPIVELYLRLNAAAGYQPEAAAPEVGAADAVVYRTDTYPLDRTRPLFDLRGIELDAARRTIAELRAGLEYRNGQLEDLRNRLEAATSAQPNTEITADVGKLDDLRRALFSSLYGLKEAVVPVDAGSEGLAMRHLQRRVRDAVQATVPESAYTLVVSGGDTELLDLWGRPTGHFPQDSSGLHAGHHPASDLAAIAHLQALRRRGASFLVVPEPAAYWFDHYRELADHVAQYRRAFDDAATATIFDLRQRVFSTADAQQELVDELWVRLGRRPDVLDCTGGAVVVRGVALMRSPVTRPPLPYVEASIDAVFVPFDDPALFEDARRIATMLVAGIGADGSIVSRHWATGTVATRSFSIATVWTGSAGGLRRLLSDLAETVPAALAVEVVVATSIAVEGDEWPGPVQFVPHAGGVADGLRVAADRAGGDIVVLVEPDSVPLPGWLPRVAEALGHAGTTAVGARVIDAYGVIAEAGGEAFADASVTLVGAGNLDVHAPDLAYGRVVDWCSTRLLAIDGRALRGVGGVPDGHASTTGAALELSLALRAAGGEVRYQPAAVVVDARQGPYVVAEEDRARIRAERGDLLKSLATSPIG